MSDREKCPNCNRPLAASIGEWFMADGQKPCAVHLAEQTRPECQRITIDRLRARVAELEAECEKWREQADTLADFREHDAIDHDVTRGYRQHAEMRVAELEAALRGTLDANRMYFEHRRVMHKDDDCMASTMWPQLEQVWINADAALKGNP